ncbi:hypothetical protein TpMuguga_01g00159 [Theileria parva strain Muguga]|uniref:Uncharacterized protein n=1 Tax=Theileria parva TaxID=5875 RepID=Q4N9F5_THEPA|nr:uncharacterized protein TpMuguga_01g00159 [Theileria parva strain Muguga]EAN33403.1 hypothetical protein TpMuguga_01g00159 [Theileria parva strain Muguga]|eukprot:XP_765686.1 hypothetical protein [Theileria parva strain Muguga]
MKLSESERIFIKSIFNSLQVNRKLFCNYLKNYSNQNFNFKDLESENEKMISLMDEILMESVNDLVKIKPFLNRLDVYSTDDKITLKDMYNNWKNDIVLRIIILKHLKRFDSVDLQRALFITLDSPYINI